MSRQPIPETVLLITRILEMKMRVNGEEMKKPTKLKGQRRWIVVFQQDGDYYWKTSLFKLRRKDVEVQVAVWRKEGYKTKIIEVRV